MSKVISLLVLAFVVYYWSYSQKLKQLAVQAARKRCLDVGVQFLDQTVVQTRISFAKDANKRWRTQRKYLFDFTSTGEQRYQGQVIIQGAFVVDVELQAYSIN